MFYEQDEYFIRRRLALIEGDAGVLPDGQTVAEARADLETAANRDARIRRARAIKKGMNGRTANEPNKWIGNRLFPHLRQRSNCCGQ